MSASMAVTYGMGLNSPHLLSKMVCQDLSTPVFVGARKDPTSPFVLFAGNQSNFNSFHQFQNAVLGAELRAIKNETLGSGISTRHMEAGKSCFHGVSIRQRLGCQLWTVSLLLISLRWHIMVHS